jgi:hypothetical protein
MRMKNSYAIISCLSVCDVRKMYGASQRYYGTHAVGANRIAYDVKESLYQRICLAVVC